MHKYVIGVDIGGTAVKMGIYAPNCVFSWSIPTDTREDGQSILTDISDSICRTLQKQRLDIRSLAGIGMGVPGPVSRDGVVHGCVNLGWEDKRVAEEMQLCFAERAGIPVEQCCVCVCNDANAAALGEAVRGGGRGYDNMVFVTLGTGVGGGIILNGRIHSGAGGSAGEIGHIYCSDTVFPGERCSCGRSGCLEQIVSASGIVHMALKSMAESEEPSVLREWKDPVRNLSVRDIFDAGKEGDLLADAVVEKACYYLGRGIAAICAVVDPEIVLIGGGISAAGEYLREKVEKHYREQAFHTLKDIPVRLAKLGNSAGMTGAAHLVLCNLQK